MWVIRPSFGGRWVVAVGLWVVVPSGPEMDAFMSWSPCLVRSVPSDDRVLVRLGHRLVDDYLEFVAARCRPNTVLAAGVIQRRQGPLVQFDGACIQRQHRPSGAFTRLAITACACS
jgi:hypothetical protein